MESAPARPIVAHVARIIPCTEAEGPGRRWALWFQGCPLRCPGCCNPEYLPFDGGEAVGVDRLADELRLAHQQYDLEGITLLGGEPFAQASAAAAIARAAWELDLTVLVFSGYTLEQLQAMAAPEVQELLRYTDMLIDGPYDRNQPETRRRWIGSANQGLHFLSGRCQWDDRWLQRNTLEIRVCGQEVIINGFPARRAAGLWKGWRRLNARTTRATE